MGYNQISNALSPCQLGIEHFNFVNWQYQSAESQNMMKLDFCEISDPDLVIDAPTQTILWNSARNMTSNIIVESGTTLKITCTIGMPKDAHIIVKQNAKLWVAEGGTITNICGGLWEGIIMEGDKRQPQFLTTSQNSTARSDQPFVFLHDATIENASVGVSVWKRSDGGVSADPTDNLGGTGGILRAEHSTFRNNHRDVGFMWYRNMHDGIEKPNLSYFEDCDFVTDDEYYAGRPDHASLWGVRGVKFLGCRFENAQELTAPEQALMLGRGIVALDAAITVNDYFPAIEYEWGEEVRQSHFTKLHEGIHLGCAPAFIYPSTIMHAEFEKCIRGIRNEGADLTTIVGNDFTIGGNEAELTEFAYYDNEDYYYQEGIILHGKMAGFVVEQNTFEKETGGSAAIVGIRSDATGASDNNIYNNVFSEMGYANLANRQNQYQDYFVPDPIPTGLMYLCNENDDNLYVDVAITEPDPNDLYQIFTGVKITQGQSNISAGNTFSHRSSLLQTDINNRAEFGDIRYWYFGAATTGNSAYPAYVTAASVVRTSLVAGGQENECPNNYLLPDDEDGDCPLCPDLSGLEDIFTGHNAAFQSGKAAYSSLIDGGISNTLLHYIDTTTNADTLVSRLSPYSPNLSTMVLDEIAQDNVLDTTRKYQLLKANAEGVNSNILRSLDRVHMPQWMQDSIAAARNNLTHRTYLLDTLMQHSAGREQAAFSALRLITEDTAGLDLGLYRNWLDSLGTTWSYYQMLGTYAYEGKLDTLPDLLAHYDSLLTNPFDSAAFANFGSYLTGYAAWITSDSSIMKLDSLNYAGLLAQAGSDLHHLKGTQMARNTLSFFYDSLYFSPGMVPTEEFAKKENEDEVAAVQKAVATHEKTVALKVYPNPAKDYLIVEYGFAENQAVRITDVYGRTMAVQQIGGSMPKVEINTANFGSGAYFLSIEHNGKSMEKAKFNIMK